MISEEVPLSCGEYTVSMIRGEAPKKPNIVYVTEQVPTSIGCYVYAVPGRNEDVHTAVLQACADTLVHDLAHRLGRVLVKKSGCPSFVCVSGAVSEMDQMELMGRVVAMAKAA